MNKDNLFEEFEGILKEYKTYLDRISEHIKEFEKKLQEACVERIYEFPISETECLAWEDKRLLYSNANKGFERNLIECTEETRIRCHQYLKPFMKKIVDELKMAVWPERNE